jgi:hypothetical protein
MRYRLVGSCKSGCEARSCGASHTYSHSNDCIGKSNFHSQADLGSLSLRNFDGNLDRGIVSRNIGHVFIAQALDDFQHHSVLALSDLVGH